MKHSIYFIFLLSISCNISAISQWRRDSPVNISDNDGYVALWSDMIQDSVGHIYFGTDKGLYRYDGNSFTGFIHDAKDSSSIGFGAIQFLHESEDGLIYLGFEDDFLHSYDRITEKFTRIKTPSSANGKTTVKSINEDKDGGLWLGSNKARMFYLPHSRDTVFTFTADIKPQKYGRNRQDIRKIIQDNKNPDILWLYVLDYDAPNSPIPWYGFLKFNKKEKIFEEVACGAQLCVQDDEGNLWGYFGNHIIVKYNPISEICDTISINISGSEKPIINDIIKDGPDLLFSSTKGIFRKNKKDQFKLEYSTEATGYDKLFVDKEQNLWKSYANGLKVYKSKGANIDFYSLNHLNFKNKIYPGRLTYDENNNAILLSIGGFLNSYEYLISIPLEKSSLASHISLDKSPGALTLDNYDNLWFCSDGKLYKKAFRGKNKSKTEVVSSLPEKWIWALQKTATGWIGGVGNTHIHWFHEDDPSIKSVNLFAIDNNQGDRKLAGVSISNNNKAYGFSDVIYETDLLKNRSRRLYFEKPFNKKSTVIKDIKVRPDGKLWILSGSAIGLFRIKDNLLVEEEIHTTSSFFKPQTSQLFLEKNRLWLFTYSGLYAVDTLTKEIRFFGKSSGIQDLYLDPIQIISLPDDRIVTVNGNGIIVFHPDSLWNSKSPKSIKTIIREIRIDGKSVKTGQSHIYTDTLVIPVKSNIIDIQFQGLSFPIDERIIYSYRLLGQDSVWTEIGNNKYVSFTNLNPGNYKFEVKAAAAKAYAPIKYIQIIVPTPFFQKWYVILILTMTGFSLIFFMLKNRIQSQQEKVNSEKELKRKLIELELKALRSQMNPHFMFNSLNSIKSYILQSDTNLAAQYLSDFSHLVRMILQHSREKLITLEEELESVLLYIDLEKMRFGNEFTFSCELQDAINLNMIQIPPLTLQPFVENAIWHGLNERKNVDSSGHLSLVIKEEGNRIFVIIEDNGIGRKKASMNRKDNKHSNYKSLGVGITNERIHLINSVEKMDLNIKFNDLYDKSGNSEGTQVIISFKSELE